MAVSTQNTLLTLQEMAYADRLTISRGTPGLTLMHNAGRAVAQAIQKKWSSCPVLVLCGPGNNGGDGFTAAQELWRYGWQNIRLLTLTPLEYLRGDAALAAQEWKGTPPQQADPESLSSALQKEKDTIVIDAIFGAGLTRELSGLAYILVEILNTFRPRLVAVDIPSGVDGDSGLMKSIAPYADMTVTFCRKKPGHLLLPGRHHAGEVLVADIGIPESIITEIQPRIFENTPRLWIKTFPFPTPMSDKYTRGHAVVVGGNTTTGAARLASCGCQRIGTGMVTLACMPEVSTLYRSVMLSSLVELFSNTDSLASLLSQRRRQSVLIGPGHGLDQKTKDFTQAVLHSGLKCVLDADALTVFEDKPEDLFDMLDSRVIMTPHIREFERLFPIPNPIKWQRVQDATQRCGSIILLKGADTVIASPDGRIAINTNAPPHLATAGSGDVLAGMIVGLLAQGMESFEAACAACWLHGAAAKTLGLGMIAEDIPKALPQVLLHLNQESRSYRDVNAKT